LPSFYDKNINIIAQRWPHVAQALDAAAPEPRAKIVEDGPQTTLMIDGIHLSSSYDRAAEAALQASLVPEESLEAWVYGLGLGDLPRVLLRRETLQCVHVVLINPAVARQSFEHFDHQDWLNDDRVDILTVDGQSQVHFPFAAVPSCLQLADDASARLRDLVVLELATPFIRKRHAADDLELQARLRENKSYVANDGDVGELFGRYPGATILVAGAGPTLGEHYEKLRNRKSPLIAVDAALKPLLQAGVVPDIVVSVDALEKGIAPYFEQADLKVCSEKFLVYFPVTPTVVLKLWPGKRFVADSKIGSCQNLTDRNSKAVLYTSGSVIHPAVDLAVNMGASRVILLGADFGYPNGKSHVDGNIYVQDVKQERGRHWVISGKGDRISSIPNLIGYLRDLETYIGHKNKVAFRNASGSGAFIQGAPLLKDGENDF